MARQPVTPVRRARSPQARAKLRPLLLFRRGVHRLWCELKRGGQRQLGRFVLQRVLVFGQFRRIGRLRNAKTLRQTAIEKTGPFQLFKTGQVADRLQAKMNEKCVRRPIGDWTPWNPPAPAQPDPAGFEQQIKSSLGDRDAANILDFGPGDRLVISDDRQRFERRARKPLGFALAAGEQPGEIGRRPEHPLAAGPHKINTARRVVPLRRFKDSIGRDAMRHALGDIFLIQGFRGGEQQSLGDTHGLGNAIIARGALVLIDLSKKLRYLSQSLSSLSLAAAVDSIANRTRKTVHRRQFALDPKRREGAVLTYRNRAFAGHFKRGGKRRSPNRAAHLGRCAKCREISVEHRPIERPASQSFNFAARMGERPDKALLKSDPAQRLFLAPVGISGQQLVETGPPLRRAGGERHLGIAAQKHVAAETRPVHEGLGGGADRLEAAQAELQRFGEVRRFGLCPFGRLGKQKPRLQIGEPRRHDEIVGRKFKPQAARRGNELQILLNESQNRNLAQIDFLAAREVEQKIKRAFKSLDIDHEGAIFAGSAVIFIERHIQTRVLPVKTSWRCCRTLPQPRHPRKLR